MTDVGVVSNDLIAVKGIAQGACLEVGNILADHGDDLFWMLCGNAKKTLLYGKSLA